MPADSETTDLATMGSWLFIALQGNPLPPDKYNKMLDAGLVLDGVITRAGDEAIKQFMELCNER